MAQALERKREILGTGHITVGVLEYEMSGVAQEMAKFNTGTAYHHLASSHAMHATYSTHARTHTRHTRSHKLSEASSEHLFSDSHGQVRFTPHPAFGFSCTTCASTSAHFDGRWWGNAVVGPAMSTRSTPG
jgi:hypothetical protein